VILIATPSITATAAIKANASNFAWLIPWPAIHIFPSEEVWRAGLLWRRGPAGRRRR
jgi:hypothetical protein